MRWPRFFFSLGKRRAIRKYARRLPRLLAKEYGFSKSYTPAQVTRTIERAGLNTYYSRYAVAMFSNSESFSAFHREIGETYDYSAIRTEVADWHFQGNSDFTISDIADVFTDSGGYSGDSLGGHHHSSFGD